uniref:Uncharacterized protein n=1 Tax=Lotus japonicus TaxID=34305 RepID=I3SD41_LOTJA|nr:unknown [Lotus japonicus]
MDQHASQYVNHKLLVKSQYTYHYQTMHSLPLTIFIYKSTTFNNTSREHMKI